MELHERLLRLAHDFGVEIFGDGDTLRAAVDDYVPEDEATNGEINLLVDAIRLGAVQRMVSVLDAGGSSESAVDGAGDLLARERGSADVAGSRWACAVVGFALGRVDEGRVRRYRGAPDSLPPVLGGAADPPPTATAPPGASPPPTAGAPEQARSADAGDRADSAPTPTETGVPDPRPAAAPTAPAPVNRAWPPAGSDPLSAPPPEPHRSRAVAIVAGVGAVVLLAAGVVFALTRGGGDGDDTASGGRATATTPSTTTPSTPSTTPSTSTETTGSGRTSGASSPPAPFQSAAMYQMARYLFDPEQRFPIRSGVDAPLAWNLDPRPDLLMKCETDGQAFAAVFLCNRTGNVGYIRDAYLSHAIDGTQETVTAPPAGWTEPVDGVQVAFKHDLGSDPRVYWDSPSSRCAAELQSSTRSLQATKQFWLNGN
jgi:hypothetical protein